MVGLKILICILFLSDGTVYIQGVLQIRRVDFTNGPHLEYLFFFHEQIRVHILNSASAAPTPEVVSSVTLA